MPRISDNIDQKLLPTLQETLAILADKKLAKELLKRRKDAFAEKEKGELVEIKDLFCE